MTLLNKAKWILGITLIFGLIATTNLLDRHNFAQLNESVISIYEDRLVAKDIILDIHKFMLEKKMAIASSDEDFYTQRNAAIDHELTILLERFEGTKPTKDEALVLEDMQGNVALLLKAEESLTPEEFGQNDELINLINQIEFNLEDLSDIQIREGRKQVSISQRASNAVEFFTQLEIGILILLAIMVQVIILYKPKKEEY